MANKSNKTDQKKTPTKYRTNNANTVKAIQASIDTIIPPIPSASINGTSMSGVKSEVDFILLLKLSFVKILPRLSLNPTPLYKLILTKRKNAIARIEVEIIEF